MPDCGPADIVFGGEICRRTLRRLLRAHLGIGLHDLQRNDDGQRWHEDELASGAMFEALEADCAAHGIPFTRTGRHPDFGDFVAGYRWGWWKAHDLPSDEQHAPLVRVEDVRRHLREAASVSPVLAWLERESPEVTPLPPLTWIDDAEDALVTFDGLVTATTAAGEETVIAGPAPVLVRLGDDGRVCLALLWPSHVPESHAGGISWREVAVIPDGLRHGIQHALPRNRLARALALAPRTPA